MVKLTIRYTIEETIDVEVEDYALTSRKLSELAEETLKYHTPDFAEDSDYEWVKPPKVKGSQSPPPEDFWFDTKFGKFAHSNCFVIAKDFLVPPGRYFGEEWRSLRENPKAAKYIEGLISKDYRSMFLHPGYFSNNFLWLKDLGVEVRGEGAENIGYILMDNKLVGLLMPFRFVGEPSSTIFRFNEPTFLEG